MYLSQLWLNPRSRQVRKDLGDCQEMHRSIMRAFPDGAGNGARDRFGVLYRVEPNSRGGGVMLLVQSLVVPDWRALDELDPDYLFKGQSTCKEIGRAYDQIETGDQLIFRLRANPTRRVSSRNVDDPLAGKRVELQTEDEQQAWLRRKGEQSGFDVRQIQVCPDTGPAINQVFEQDAPESTPIPDARVVPGQKVIGGRKTRRRLTFGAVRFDGHLQVTDADRFRESLRTGIGPAKAYGFGLLSVGRGGGV